MKLIDRNHVARLREQYPAGCMIRLVSTDDPYTMLKPGDTGKLIFIDDAGTLHIVWENGSGLGLIPGIDQFTMVKENAE